MCQVSHVKCHVSRVTCHLSLPPTATQTLPLLHPSLKQSVALSVGAMGKVKATLSLIAKQTGSRSSGSILLGPFGEKMLKCGYYRLFSIITHLLAFGTTDAIWYVLHFCEES